MQVKHKATNWGRDFNWTNVLPPSRPSLGQLHHLSGLLRQIERDVPVAVMGSTPEYRDLLALHDFPNVTVIDASRSFHRSMSQLRSTTSSETFDESDWIDHFERSEGKYGLVLSDLTSGNIPYERRAEYYSALRSALRPKGTFFDKILLHQKPFRRLHELAQIFSRTPLTVTSLNYFNCAALFTSELLAGEILDTNTAYGELSAYSANENWQRFVEANRSITPNNCVWYYGKRYRSLRAVYADQFEIVSRVVDRSPIGYEGWVSWLSLQRRD